MKLTGTQLKILQRAEATGDAEVKGDQESRVAEQMEFRKWITCESGRIILGHAKKIRLTELGRKILKDNS